MKRATRIERRSIAQPEDKYLHCWDKMYINTAFERMVGYRSSGVDRLHRRNTIDTSRGLAFALLEKVYIQQLGKQG